MEKKKEKIEIPFKKNFNVLSFVRHFFFFHIVEIEIERILLIQRSNRQHMIIF